MPASETVELVGHLLDSGLLSRIVDDVGEYGADFSFDSFAVGRKSTDESRATITVSAADSQALARVLMRLQTHGVNLVDPGEARTREVEHDGVFPDDFYSTTNLDTVVRLGSTWVDVEQPEMDWGLLVWDDDGRTRVRTIPVSEVRAGQRVVCGAAGVRVRRVPRLQAGDKAFKFMDSQVSTEKPQALLVRQIAEQMRSVKAVDGRILWVAGPAVVHTGAAPAMVALVRAGYVDVLFGGNAIATHDIESALYGTSLGVDLAHGRGVEHGHEHHIRATGNILPASIPLVCVDINPAAVTKLADRGSVQARGIVTDIGLFLEQLALELVPGFRD